MLEPLTALGNIVNNAIKPLSAANTLSMSTRRLFPEGNNVSVNIIMSIQMNSYSSNKFIIRMAYKYLFTCLVSKLSPVTMINIKVKFE